MKVEANAKRSELWALGPGAFVFFGLCVDGSRLTFDGLTGVRASIEHLKNFTKT